MSIDNKLTAAQLRELAARDQSEAAKRDGHQCTYSCDCDCEWIELEPLDSAHCPRDEMSGPARFSGVMVCVAVVAMFWIVVLAAVWEWVTR